MNVSLLLGSGRMRSPEPLSSLSPTPALNRTKDENELDALNRRLDLKQISFVDYLTALDGLIEKEYL
jgi:hypothetical protein